MNADELENELFCKLPLYVAINNEKYSKTLKMFIKVVQKTMLTNYHCAQLIHSILRKIMATSELICEWGILHMHSEGIIQNSFVQLMHVNMLY